VDSNKNKIEVLDDIQNKDIDVEVAPEKRNQ
jgi:hypothetical protein